MYICIYVCMYVCMYVSMYVCMYLGMYVFMYVGASAADMFIYHVDLPYVQCFFRSVCLSSPARSLSQSNGTGWQRAFFQNEDNTEEKTNACRRSLTKKSSCL